MKIIWKNAKLHFNMNIIKFFNSKLIIYNKIIL